MSSLTSLLPQRLEIVKKCALLLGFLMIFLGCGIQSNLNSPSDQFQKNLNASSSSAGTETSQQSPEETNAIRLVSAAIESNKLNVTSKDLKAKKNPKGAGSFVYVPQTRYSGVERYVIWIVLDSKAFALNSPSKMVTPSLPWPRDTDDATWNKTGINKYNGATEAIDILFGTETATSSINDRTAIGQMEIAFEGGYRKEEIKARLDQAMELYGLAMTEDNYSRAGSTLVALRQKYKAREMDILSHMISSHVPGVDMHFADAASISCARLVTGR